MVARDERPFGGPDPPVAAYFYSPDRRGEHPQRYFAGYSGVLQADAYSGFGQLYEPGRPAGPILEAACWAYARRACFKLATVQKAPMAIEAVSRIGALFAIERGGNGAPAQVRLAVRRERARPLVEALWLWMQASRSRLSGKSDMGKAFDYVLRRWASFTRLLDDGCACLTNNAAEQAIRPIAVGQRNWTFAGSDVGGHRAAAMDTLIETCRMNEVDPRAWLADVIARLPEHPASRVDELLPWNWKAAQARIADAARGAPLLRTPPSRRGPCRTRPLRTTVTLLRCKPRPVGTPIVSQIFTFRLRLTSHS